MRHKARVTYPCDISDICALCDIRLEPYNYATLVTFVLDLMYLRHKARVTYPCDISDICALCDIRLEPYNYATLVTFVLDLMYMRQFDINIVMRQVNMRHKRYATSVRATKFRRTNKWLGCQIIL